jgi:hypothetical protein
MWTSAVFGKIIVGISEESPAEESPANYEAKQHKP